MKYCYLLLLCAIGHYGFAQSVPTPAAEQAQPIVLRGATIHQGNGDLLQGNILIEDGKITDIGTAAPPTDAKVFNLAGKHVYPGLISVNSFMGLEEINAVRASKDASEVGGMNPNARAIIAYNTDSWVTPTNRSNGILIAQIAPQGRLFSGTSSVVQLDAWNWEDAIVEADDAVYMRFPRMEYRQAFWLPPIEKQKKQTKKQLDMLHQEMTEAKAYYLNAKEGKAQAHNLAFEALKPLFAQEKRLFIRANSEKEILAAIEFGDQYDVQIVVVGGKECHLQLDLLKEKKIPVVLNKIHQLPVRADDPIDLPYRVPKMLHDAGIPYCYMMDEMWNERNLPFQAGTAAAYGLSKEEALMGITANAAQILGIDDRLGSIEIGKDATLIVTEGDLLDMRSSNVMHAFIEGREIDLGNKQKDLYEKFRTKYE